MKCQTTWLPILTLALFVVLLCGPQLSRVALGDENTKALIASAYKRSKTAKSVEDYTEILTLCQQARQGELTEKMDKYVAELMSWAHNRRGETYARDAAEATVAGQTTTAAELDTRALEDFDTAIVLDGTRWKPWLNRGVALGVAGRHELAIKDFTQVLALDATQVDAWFNRAEILSDMGRYEDALADYDEVVRIAPDDADAYLGRGTALFRLGAADAALEAYAEAIQHAETVAPYLRRADVLQAVGRWEEAAADCRRAIAIDRESAAAYHAAAWLMATCPEDSFRDVELALEAAERALELDPTEPWQLLDTLAAAKANAGSYEEAVDWAMAAFEAAPIAQRAAVQQRLDLYRKQQPFRQSIAPAAARTPGGLRR